MKLSMLGLGGAALLALAACDETMMTEEVMVSEAPTEAQQICLAAVSAEANTGEVVLQGSSFSEAETMVQVSVGPNQAPWQCIAYADGTTDGIMFLGDEGML